MLSCPSFTILLAYLLANQAVSAYTPSPRWGQAVAIINDALFVHGGKTDQFNAYSYTAAPTSNDLLYLSFSSPFTTSSVPWQAISGTANSTASNQSPTLAWHTLSAFNTSEILLFGGLPDVNSDVVLMGQADSAIILDVYDRESPRWEIEATSWANEPIRRMRHSTCSCDGKIWIFGGERADGSNSDFSDHYVFDPNSLSFTPLPSSNGPTQITGHTSIVLSNGLILVFGGVVKGSLVSLSQIWIFDTKKMTWSTVTISGNSPSGRRGFAAVLLGGGKILIHGGTDEVFQETYSDGWILDTSKNPMVWSKVDALSQLGARRDHFAVAQGDQVIFGFGYGSSSPAPADIQIYDSNSGQWTDSFTPIPITASPTLTLPGPTQTSHHGSHTGGSPSGTGTGVHPTNTVQSPNDGGSPSGNSSKVSSGAAIALGVTLGMFVVVGSAIAVAYYVRRRNNPESDFHMISGHDDFGGGNPHLTRPVPGLGVSNNVQRSGTIMNSLGLGVIASAAARAVSGRPAYPERRDMLADEDTREFGWGYGQRQQKASAGSTWSLSSVGAFFGGARKHFRSREPSLASTMNTPWQEKADPFSDGAALMANDDAALPGTSSFVPIPAPISSGHRGGRESTYSSYSINSYRDPFTDPIEEEWTQQHNIGGSTDSLRLVQPGLPTPLMTMYPPSTGLHTLSPLSERTSRSSMSFPSNPSNASHSHEHVVSPFESVHNTSYTSHESQIRAPSVKRHTSIVDALQPANLRRSDTWWSRFSRTSFLDRRHSDSRRPSGMFDLRDPNPPPRLVAIEEKSIDSKSPNASRGNSGNSQVATPPSRRASRMFTRHGRSQSSLQTAGTADSEALERMGAVDVVQRLVSESRRTRESTNSSFGTDADGESRPLAFITNGSPGDGSSANVASPGEMTLAESLHSWTTVSHSGTPSPHSTPPAETGNAPPLMGQRTKSGGAVAARVQAYERRMSQEPASPPLSPRAKKTGRVSVNYGLAPRPSLFVANPDHRSIPSAESSIS